jgi:hypothetical protein
MGQSWTRDGWLGFVNSNLSNSFFAFFWLGLSHFLGHGNWCLRQDYFPAPKLSFQQLESKTTSLLASSKQTGVEMASSSDTAQTGAKYGDRSVYHGVKFLLSLSVGEGRVLPVFR